MTGVALRLDRGHALSLDYLNNPEIVILMYFAKRHIIISNLKKAKKGTPNYCALPYFVKKLGKALKNYEKSKRKIR